MTDLTDTDFARLVSLIALVTSPIECNARLGELRTLRASILADLDRAEAEQREAAAVVAQAGEALAQLKLRENALASKELDVEQREERLKVAEHPVALREQQVADRAVEMDRREAALASREAAVAEQEVRAQSMLAKAAEAQESAERKLAALRAVAA